jgi:hypothetical protein
LEVEVPIRIMFEDPTIKGLAKEVEEANAKGIKAIAPIYSLSQKRNPLDQLSLQVEKMSRQELEDMLRQVLKDKSAGTVT